MFVSPRFRDIFSSRPLRSRRQDRSVEGQTAAGRNDSPATDAEVIWLDITAAHRRAYRSLTPEFIRAEDLAAQEE
jgi:hypothetical protein